MDEEKKEEGLNYYDMIQEEWKIIAKADDPRIIEAHGKVIYNIGKLNSEDILEEQKADTERMKVENEAEANRLKAIELEQQAKRDEDDIRVRQEAVEQSDKDSKRRLIGNVLAFVGSVAVVAVNIAGAKDFATHVAGLEEGGALLNMNKKMIPNFFARNK